MVNKGLLTQNITRGKDWYSIPPIKGDISKVLRLNFVIFIYFGSTCSIALYSFYPTAADLRAATVADGLHQDDKGGQPVKNPPGASFTERMTRRRNGC